MCIRDSVIDLRAMSKANESCSAEATTEKGIFVQDMNFYAEAKVFEGLKVNLGYEYVQRKEYVIEEGNSSRDFGLSLIHI